jgi:L-lactate dehydrogenase complex protein LldG
MPAMTDARTAMLNRIRSAVADDERIDAAADYAGIPRTYIREGMLDPESRLHLLLERLRDYDTHVVETSAASLPQTIASVLREHQQKKVIAADGLPEQMLPRDFGFIPERNASLDDLNTCDGIVTICSVAIAFTGSIVLTHGPGEGARRLSLLPDRHLCIVRAEQVVETVPEAFDRLAGLATHPLTFISGPSATADIEMTRIRGVHGPRFLDVVLVR